MNLIYRSRFFATYQSDSQRCFFLELGQRRLKLSCCQLLALRQKLKDLDLTTHFNGRNRHGMEIVSLCNRDHILLLDTHEVIDLKQLIKSTFGLLELNSMLQD